jgi:hypothetical protein
MPAWSMVSLIEPSPHDAAAAYAAIDRHKLDDLQAADLPYPRLRQDVDSNRQPAFRTAPTCVRCARTRCAQGLLYAGTELGVYFSVDDGAQWQPLQLNLPTCRCTTSSIKDDDLVAATHGRSFWILDDVSPLRQAVENGPRPWRISICSQPAHAGDSCITRAQVERRLPVGDNPPRARSSTTTSRASRRRVRPLHSRCWLPTVT